MKKLMFVVIIILLAVLIGDIRAVELTKWKYRSRIIFERDTQEYVRLSLNTDIYDAAKIDLADIRIIDENENQVPFIITQPQDKTSRLKYNPKVINRSYNSLGHSLITLDFAKKVMKNSIEVVTQGNNFRRPVLVEGSNDNIEFFTLVKRAYVFAVSHETNARFSRIDLPSNDYRYLRITVKPMTDEEKNVVINEVGTFKYRKKLAERKSIRMLSINHFEDANNNSSVYEYDLGFRNLPVTEIQLDVPNDFFYRYVTIEGRNQTSRKVEIHSEDNRQRFREVPVKFGTITSGSIYRYTTDSGDKKQSLTLSMPNNTKSYRYLKITVKNYDDMPIAVKSASAKMIPHQLVFEPADSNQATLYVGSELAAKPRYDLSHRLTKPLQVDAAIAALAALTENPLFGKTETKPLAWTERHKVLLIIIMITTVAVLGIFILKSFNSIQNQQQEKQ